MTVSANPVCFRVCEIEAKVVAQTLARVWYLDVSSNLVTCILVDPVSKVTQARTNLYLNAVNIDACTSSPDT